MGLLATGPLVGSVWLAMAAASGAGVGRAPPGLALVPALFAVVLAMAVPAALVSVLASGRLSRWLPAGPRLAPTVAGRAARRCLAARRLLA
jgi:hypothetical protein